MDKVLRFTSVWLWGDCPLTYALYAEAPIEVINYLFKTHMQMWGTLLFDFAHMLQRLAKYAYLD